MVIEVHFFKKKKKEKKKIETWTKSENHFFQILFTLYITTQQILYTGYFIKSEINFKLKVKMNYIWFSMGIDHSNSGALRPVRRNNSQLRNPAHRSQRIQGFTEVLPFAFVYLCVYQRYLRLL